MELGFSSCERYVKRVLGDGVRLIEAAPLPGSSRPGPWRLTVDVDGLPKSFALRAGGRNLEREFHVLRALEPVAIPTPRVFGWEPSGELLGVPGFLVELVAGESLKGPLLAGESWAEGLYLDAVCSLQSISRDALPGIQNHTGPDLTAESVLGKAHQDFARRSDALAESAYRRLRQSKPETPAPLFSNGDLWPDNFIIRGRRLVGIIDFEKGGFSDPIYEFLLAFFVSPDLRGRGLEQRYCRIMNLDPDVLPWYRGLERFATLAYVVRSGNAFANHTETSLRGELERWLAGDDV